MTIHREGKATIALTFAVLALLNTAVFYFLSDSPVLCWTILGISIVFFLFIVSFFRIPSREMNFDERLVVAPADGKIVVIEETYEPEYFRINASRCLSL